MGKNQVCGSFPDFVYIPRVSRLPRKSGSPFLSLTNSESVTPSWAPLIRSAVWLWARYPFILPASPAPAPNPPLKSSQWIS